MHRIIAHSHIILISCLLIDNACYDYLHANSTECGSSGKYTVCQVCVSVRCAMRDAVALQESAANPNRSHFSSFHVFEIYSCNSYSSYYEKHLAYSTFIFLFCYYKQYFFLVVLSIVLIFIWSSVCVCVAKWHSIPLVKD